MKSLRVKMACRGCGRQGVQAFGDCRKLRWCRCVKSFGPIVAAPGTVVRLMFESEEDARFRERCRLAANAEHDARHAWREGRWVRCGKGYRRLPDNAKKVIALAKAHDDALAALEALQALCSHEGRSIFDREMCDCCYARVAAMRASSHIAQHRHFVREGILSA